MKILLSPTKKQIITPVYKDIYTLPSLINKAEELMTTLSGYSENDLQGLLSVSKRIAEEAWFKNDKWRSNPDKSLGSSAIFSFKGEVFRYLQPDYLTDEDIRWADNRLRILSGLYGILKPLDTIMPYRVDIGDRITIGKYKNLYDFWGSSITDFLIDDLENSESQYVLDLSSIEYSRSVDFNKLPAKTIKAEFKMESNGKHKTVPTMWAKQLRGLMARAVIKNRVKTEEELQKITLDSYKLADTENGSYLYIKEESLK